MTTEVIARAFGSVELACLAFVAVLAITQGVIGGEQGVLIRRNLAETFPLAVLLVALLSATGSYGEFSRTGALLYAAGRLAYFALTLRAVRTFRRFAWASSVAGLIGLALQLAAFLATAI